jgi:hypothetical protein
VSHLAQRAAASVGPTGTRAGLRIGLYLSGLLGAAPERARSHPSPYAPKSDQPTGSASMHGGVVIGVPPWLGALEVVAAGASGVTYRVSWGIETAKSPKPDRATTSETVTQFLFYSGCRVLQTVWIWKVRRRPSGDAAYAFGPRRRTL